MTSPLLPEVEIYSDWGARPNPGPGAYGVILKYKGIQKDISQGYTHTTNNRMELMGAIAGLKLLKTKSKVTMFLDSQYTINGIQKWWAVKWRASNWFRSKSEKAINADLWEELLTLIEKHEVRFEWVKWHNGHIENELCDELATLAMQGKNLLVDTGFMENNTSEKQKPLSIFAATEKSKSETLWEKTKRKILNEWDLCRKCKTPVIKRIPKHTQKNLKQSYYFEYFFQCPCCKTNYMVDEAKKDIKSLKI